MRDRGVGAEVVAPAAAHARIGDWLALTKPRIMALLLFTGLTAMVVADRGAPPWPRVLATLVGLGLSTGGAAALNMWFDRDIDRVMTRTQNRPIPSGRIGPGQVVVFGLVLEAIALAVLALAVNPLTALLAGLGFVYYVGIYTMWLKRRTPQNIVIGGGAGAFPPLVGWAAATGHLSWAAVWMFLVIFLWTPPHFWSLALYKNDDYVRADVPMMPVVKGPRATKVQSLVYGILLAVSSVLLYLTHVVGLIYLGGALALGLVFVAVLGRSLAEPEGEDLWAKRSFRISLLYLLGIFFFMWVNVKA